MSTPALRFLADEGCDFAVVRALREAGFDVVAVCEIMRGSNDSDIIKLSHAGNRVLLTEDKDFGWLVFVKPCRFGRCSLDTVSGKCAFHSPRYRSLAC
jgi:predicted nuclease of predicted toxin-antitoxin system